MDKSQVYASEDDAREAAKLGYEAAVNTHGEENCALSTEARAIILTRPDQMDGVATIRYEW